MALSYKKTSPSLSRVGRSHKIPIHFFISDFCSYRKAVFVRTRNTAFEQLPNTLVDENGSTSFFLSVSADAKRVI